MTVRAERIVDEVFDRLRRNRQVDLNSQPGISQESLAAQYGPVWTSTQLLDDFEVRGFLAPYVVVRRKCDGAVGSMEFTHAPRFYFNFKPYEE